MSMLLITPMLVAQNATLSLWEENLEQLSADEEERNWEDELETLSARLQEPVNINAATKRQLEEFPFLTDIQIENILAYVYINCLQGKIFLFAILLQICLEITLIIELQFFIETTKKHATRLQIIRSNFADKR